MKQIVDHNLEVDGAYRKFFTSPEVEAENTDKTTLAVLVEADSFLSSEDKWTKGSMYRDGNDVDLMPVFDKSDLDLIRVHMICKACLVGALRLARYNLNLKWHTRCYDEVRKTIAIWSLPDFNDNATYADVKDILSATIERVRHEVQQG